MDINRLLILEDSKLDAELILREVRGMTQQFDIRIVSEKDDFDQAVQKWKPEIIISDFNLQTFSGDEALAFAKKHLPNTPFITLSGSVTREIELKQLKNRANDVLKKDNFKKLPYVIRRVLNEKKDKEKLERLLKALEENVKIQETLAEIALSFNSQKDFSDKVNIALRLLGEVTDVSRVYIFEDFEDGTKARNSFEWCGEGVSPQIDKLQDISYSESIPAWKPHLSGNGKIYCESMEDLPDEFHDFLKVQDIKSLIVYPIHLNEEFFGFIGFDEVRESRKWTESEDKLLKSISGLISNAYSEELAKQKLKASNKKLTELLREKEALVGEVHHRVKNNLALISSFLQLDQLGIGSPKTTDEIVSANILRIKSIAIIHELVYQDSTFSNICVLKTVEKILAESFSEKRGLRMDLEVEDGPNNVFFNINLAVPFSLLLSEIMFQVFSIKGEYKYEANQRVKLKVEEHNETVLVYIKESKLVRILSKLQEGKELDFSEIIDVLAKQIGAQIIINEDQNVARIEFKNKNVKGASTTLIK